MYDRGDRRWKQNAIVGMTFALTQCPAWTQESGDAKLSGLYTVDEWEPCDPGAHCHESGVWVFRTDDRGRDDLVLYFITDYDLTEQAFPKEHGKMLEHEREMEFGAEEASKAWDDLFPVDDNYSDNIPF